MTPFSEATDFSDDIETPETVIEDWGWSGRFEESFARERGEAQVPARVIESNRERYRLVASGADGRAIEVSGEPSGTLRKRCVLLRDMPAVGDWVLARRPPYDGPHIVDGVLTRVSAFTRKAAGTRDAESDTDQILAANVDIACIVCAAGNDWSPRRIERYITLAWDSGARPLLAVTKADLAEDRVALEAEAARAAPGVDLFVTSAVEGSGIAELAAMFERGRTAVFLGSSGAGKSTLINAISGAAVARIGSVKDYDQRGRHTTTTRSLYRLPGGALAIDTPGLREVQLNSSEDSLAETFPEIEKLTGECRFRDCRHDDEPGCAVRAALESGGIDMQRYKGWLKLQREIVFFTKDTDRKAKAIFEERARRMQIALRSHRKEQRDASRRKT